MKIRLENLKISSTMRLKSVKLRMLLSLRRKWMRKLRYYNLRKKLASQVT